MARRKATKYNIPFKDHTGRPALMSWLNAADEPSLPPLSSWVFYMVHPDFSLKDFDGDDFIFHVEDNDRYSGGACRTEFFLLPGATAEECVQHYRAEIEARGTIWRQVRQVAAAVEASKRRSARLKAKKEEQESQSHHDGNIKGSEAEPPKDQVSDSTRDQHLPGLVWAEEERDCLDIRYRGWFFLYPYADAQWGPDHKNRQVSAVMFDPIPNDLSELEEGEVYKFDPMQHPVHIKSFSLYHNPPRSQPGDPDYVEGLEYEGTKAVHWMGDRMHAKRWEEACNVSWNTALGMGWETW
ncbi:hypothetical protein B0I35DRAFT_426303 [Stachybotrys elegans]|uniref:Uncharacterized protein n=1 Tax=Stachybotrys elegans TaxID=80388 RepID=A0A8K0WSY9_9HYPO|nr:hypothetical protein B0I35DRAFT_426303 [Stachybotrys elegans]